MVGALAAAYWLARPSDVAYLLFALATVTWYIRTLHFWIDEPVVGEDWHVWLHINALTWLMTLVYSYAFRLLARRLGWVDVALLTLVTVVAMLTLPGTFGHHFVVSTLAYALQSAIAVGVTVLITWGALLRRDLDVAVLAASLWLNLALGVHDLLLKEMLIDIERVYLLPYGGVAIFAAFLYSAQRRFLAAIEGIERSNVELEQRVRARREQLQAAFARLSGLERERAQAEERQRLLREMHDGLGSSLMSSLVLVEQGKMDIAAVSQVLRECVDDLKLTMDSMEPIEGDLATLLATLRYRLGRRLEGAGLTMRWEVGDLPPLPWLDSAAALQVLRILQEALANVVKHAQASSITVSTAVEDGRVKVCVDDDGRGLPSESKPGQDPGGRGLRNMRRRAEEVGAQFALEPLARGTRVALWLPLQRGAARAPDHSAPAA
jgi:signal transduction histidine kinase